MTYLHSPRNDFADLTEQKILVVGLGKTGCSVCKFLFQQQIAFDAVDNREKPPVMGDAAQYLSDAQIFDSFSETLFCGYDVLVVSPGVALSTPAIQAAIEKGVKVIGDVELFARTVNAPVIAVTGSNGKSTVVAWLDSVLRQTSLNAVLCGNIGEPVLSSLDENADVYVVELSSFQLETTYSLKTLSASVLNISEDHMDRYENLEHYASVKRRIYQECENPVVNADDSLTWPAEPIAGQANVVRFSTAAPTGSDFGIQQHEGEDWLASATALICRSLDLPLPGQHNALNALAVLALLRPLGISNEKLVSGLKTFCGLPHRTQLVAEIAGVRWYNDSKGTNVDACQKAINAMTGPVILIMGGQGKDADFSSLRDTVEKHVKSLILIGEDASLIAAALDGVVEPLGASDMSDAVSQAAHAAVSGDVVLLSPACASFDMYDSFEHRGDVFMEAVQRVAA
ncbi:MAG: UDP-N-acetylmuramoyl-L-alanine--D-glutamate ligase [Granulosicoccus sp.]|nr:UDP-N-acetylmuramoyl-L-alanine--D-glutamate ligase [Granulosicoccus sp.]